MVLDILAVLVRLARHSLESAVRVRRKEGNGWANSPVGSRFILWVLLLVFLLLLLF